MGDVRNFKILVPRIENLRRAFSAICSSRIPHLDYHWLSKLFRPTSIDIGLQDHSLSVYTGLRFIV